MKNYLRDTVGISNKANRDDIVAKLEAWCSNYECECDQMRQQSSLSRMAVLNRVDVETTVDPKCPSGDTESFPCKAIYDEAVPIEGINGGTPTVLQKFADNGYTTVSWQNVTDYIICNLISCTHGNEINTIHLPIVKYDHRNRSFKFKLIITLI